MVQVAPQRHQLPAGSLLVNGRTASSSAEPGSMKALTIQARSHPHQLGSHFVLTEGLIPEVLLRLIGYSLIEAALVASSWLLAGQQD